ncbi:MAG: hypothetical protein IKE38_01280 [Erysipelotrichaceae bacterium]|nr:hypothetical protein [Erysipelotrichaceae bacterium]
MMKAIIFFVALVSVYCIAHILNHRTKRPEGCEDLRKDCATCNIVSCPASSVYEGGNKT